MPGLKRSGVMILEGKKYISEEEAKEMAYVATSLKKIYKHPDVELRTVLGFFDFVKIGGWIFMMVFIWYPALAVLSAVVSGVFPIYFGPLIILYFIFMSWIFSGPVFPYYFRRKLYRKMLRNDGKISEKTFIHLNEVGVFLKTDGNTTAGIYWDNVSFVRFFPKCILFCPKGKRDLGVVLVRYYEQPVREFLSIYHSDIPIY